MMPQARAAKRGLAGFVLSTVAANSGECMALVMDERHSSYCFITCESRDVGTKETGGPDQFPTENLHYQRGDKRRTSKQQAPCVDAAGNPRPEHTSFRA